MARRIDTSWGKGLDLYKPCELVTGCGLLQEGDATSSEATPFHHGGCHGGDTQSLEPAALPAAGGVSLHS